MRSLKQTKQQDLSSLFSDTGHFHAPSKTLTQNKYQRLLRTIILTKDIKPYLDKIFCHYKKKRYQFRSFSFSFDHFVYELGTDCHLRKMYRLKSQFKHCLSLKLLYKIKPALKHTLHFIHAIKTKSLAFIDRYDLDTSTGDLFLIGKFASKETCKLIILSDEYDYRILRAFRRNKLTEVDIKGFQNRLMVSEDELENIGNSIQRFRRNLLKLEVPGFHLHTYNIEWSSFDKLLELHG